MTWKSSRQTFLSKIHDDRTCIMPLVSEKFFHCFNYIVYSSILINDPQGMINLDFRDMVGRMYVGDC